MVVGYVSLEFKNISLTPYSLAKIFCLQLYILALRLNCVLCCNIHLILQLIFRSYDWLLTAISARLETKKNAVMFGRRWRWSVMVKYFVLVTVSVLSALDTKCNSRGFRCTLRSASIILSLPCEFLNKQFLKLIATHTHTHTSPHP